MGMKTDIGDIRVKCISCMTGEPTADNLCTTTSACVDG